MAPPHLTGSGVLALALLAALVSAAGRTVPLGQVRGTGPTREVGPEESPLTTEILPFLQQHCRRCHGTQRPMAGFRIDALPADLDSLSSQRSWQLVLDKLSSGEMPPQSEEARPTSEASRRVAERLGRLVEDAEAARLSRREGLSFYRLSRDEYQNTVSDLLGVTFDVADPQGLNEDEAWNGFKRIGSALSASPSHVERYLEAAEAILAEAYPDHPTRNRVTRVSALELLGDQALFDRELEPTAPTVRVDLWPGQSVGIEPPGAWIETAGRYRIRIRTSGLEPRGGPAPHLVLRADSIDRLLFEVDVRTREDEPVIVETETHLPKGKHHFTLTHELPGPPILARLGQFRPQPFKSLEEGYVPWQIVLQDSEHRPLEPLLIVDWIELEGPLPPLRDRKEQTTPLPTEIREVAPFFSRFAERAFRRPLNPGELDPYVALVEQQLESGNTLSEATKTGMAAVLTAPQFLYLIEGSPTADPLLTDWELASRLSYFLWSTTPDDELLVLARQRVLTETATLEAQVRRLLADPRSERFAKGFARQWLQLDRVGEFTPDAELYPDYDGTLERSMVGESVAFFTEVLSQNLSLGELLDSNWTVLNERLARHYGISGVEGSEWRRVALDDSDHRGGLLTQASVLSLTSDGARHRPVHRGVWLSEVILGKRPPPPPANVAAIPPNRPDRPKSSVRDQIEAHRSDPTCAACHRRIDPLGFAFDHYDAIGRWRDEESVPFGTGKNPPIDASGVLPDGREFADASELRQLLVDDLDDFTAVLGEKIATYALRRPLSPSDRLAVRKLVAPTKAEGYRLRDVIESLVLSDLFRSR